MPCWGDVHDKTKWTIMPLKFKRATTLDAIFEVDKDEIKIVNIKPFNIGFASKVTTKQKGN